ncbi:Uu.00g014670.m01.CDS01 [Anthostomella pinea]|uniref:alpha-1,2-Mannosidase n=1 Tax=Anthostomella pinea TaxID=933095 RepID=A0AAI8VZL0_9PEZI|nr:Uu.00g014670.m01.CDS01 [Anthostomella pinea]
MNVRDPFNLHRTSALSILRTAVPRAAADLTERVVDAGAHAIERGKQAVDQLDLQLDMSFSVPKNVPSFSNPQRLAEDRVWGNSAGAAVTARGPNKNGGILGGVQDRLFDSDARNTLPMYKDKPYAYPASHRARPLWRRKRTLGFLLLLLSGLYYFGAFERHRDTALASGTRWGGWLTSSSEVEAGKPADWPKRSERVVEAFTLSFDAYSRYAWGYDEYHPVSKKGHQMAPQGMGWIIVDALDTMILMNLTSRVTHAREWISNSLSYDQDQDVNTFETTIRMLGGLLAAHYLSTEFPTLAPLADDDPGTPGEDLYLEKAKDLADRLIVAFDSPSGVPYASVNLAKFEGIPAHDEGGASSTAETTTLQLEFKYLAKLTGEKYFWDKAEKVMEVVDNNGAEGGLVPIYINAKEGTFRGYNIRLGSRGDSYYEYLIKQYLQTKEKEPVYLEMWDESLQGVRDHLVTYTDPSGFTIIGERPEGLWGALSPKMDHLVCFMPGTIALGATGGLTEAEAKKLPTWSKKNEADMELARELMQTCWGMYKWMATGLAAEITYFNVANPPPRASAPHQAPAGFDEDPHAEWRKDYDVHSNDVHNLQRPETVESLFYMWRITGDIKYREWGWDMFKSFMNHTAVEDGGGFSSLSNANKLPPVMRDNMESFWLAETLKYMYLLFSPNDLLPLDKIVINTEAHPLPRFDLGQLFSTGWTRRARDADGKIIQPFNASRPAASHTASPRAPPRPPRPPRPQGGPRDVPNMPPPSYSHDIEMNIFPIKEGSLAPGSSYTMREPLYDETTPPRFLDRLVDGFRRDPNQRITPKNPFSDFHAAGPARPQHLSMLAGRRAQSHYYDMRQATLQTAQSHLARKLKGRHLQMIAIGGSIGTGLFVSSGRALESGGPASILLAYSFIGSMLYCTVQALGELAVSFPVAGSFSAYSTRFLDPSWGFAMGWNYALQWLVALPLEIIAASITITYWNPNIDKAIFVTIFLLAVVVINLFGVKGYGEAEFIFAIVKVTAVIGFILLGIVLNIGGVPDGGYIGGLYWRDPGAFHNGFKGLCSVFVTAAFAFAGTELVGLAAAETANPRKSLPTAIKQVFWRITLFYIVALTLIGLLVPYNDPRLLISEGAPAVASPFVIAIENAGIEVLPSIMNVVILIAVLSVGNSSVFGASRTIAALADQNQAPRILSYVDRRGRPLVAILLASSVGLLSYLADLKEQGEVLDWLVAISGLSSVFTWGSICLAHIRFRQAWARAGHSVSELAFQSQVGVAGSWLGFVFNILVLIAQFWVGAWPVGFQTMTSAQLAKSFFLVYLAAPVVILFYAAHRLWNGTGFVRLADMDIDTGRRDFNLPILVAQESEEMKGWPRWKKLYKFMC